MRFLFRADGNSEIGIGHIMRCLSLAIALRKRGADCIFATADDTMREAILRNDFRNICMDTDWRKLPSELPVFIEWVQSVKPDMLIVDSYGVTSEYFLALRERVFLSYFDDIAAFLYPVDCLINYSVVAKDVGYASTYPKETKLLLGVEYAPLREEFSGIIPVCRKEVKNVLLLTGGADPLGIGISLLDGFLNDSRFDNLNFHIVLGQQNEQATKVLAYAAMHANVFPHENVKKMSALMQTCDVAVSASGSTLYELCACGIPTICYTFADNQIASAKKMSHDGIMDYVGDFRTDKRFINREIQKALLDLIGLSFAVRRDISIKQRALIDGNGADRLAMSLYNFCTRKEARPWQ